MPDLLLRGATVIDGTGAAPKLADILVTDARIASLLDPGTDAHADRVMDLDGLVICPGFIDMHSHSDLQVLVHPTHESRLLQGITSEVLGQDGLSYAPVDDSVLARLRVQLEGWNGDPDGFDWSWRTVREYLDRLRPSIAVNVAYLVPHGNLRLLVVGDEDRAATADELDRMCVLLREALADGAVGLSTGLTYVPASYSNTAELVALCRVVAEAGGYFCPHHRNYGSRVLEGYRECIEIARDSGVSLHLAHTHLSFPQNAGRLDELLELIDGALEAGVDLSFDSYPYLAGMTSLHALLPGWVQAGGVDEQLARLSDPAVRDRVREELDALGSDGNQGLPVDWSTVRIASVGRASGFDDAIGRSIAEIAAVADADPATLYLDLVVASGLSASCTLHFGIEEHVRTLMRHPRHTVGTDGILVGARPHPRSWGTFPRMLGHYSRDERVLPLTEAIRHMTSAPADRLRQPDRGRVVEGAFADLVVFDPVTVIDTASYEHPRSAPIGVHHVFVNGVPAVLDGKITGEHAGHIMSGLTPAE